MTDLRQAAQAVVDQWDSPRWKWSQQGPTADLMAALRTALVQQQTEPIGWLDGNDKLAEFMHRDLKAEHDKRGSATPRDFTVPVYTAPPQRKPLTDEQIIGAMHEDGCERIENFYVVGPVQKAAVFSFARAVEAKIKEGA